MFGSRSRYAGYANPEEVLTDSALSDEQKRETLMHWRATLWRQRETDRRETDWFDRQLAGQPQAAGQPSRDGGYGALLEELDSARAVVEARRTGGSTAS